jgi:exopolysaccharide biosynthesis WecB/TagA/CpsF family protein
VQISVTDYDELVGCILDSAIAGEPAVVSLFAVHAVITASDDPDLRRKVNTFQAIGPDGQPVRWAMNWLHKTKLSDRVYGPETTLRICKAAADEEVPIYLYGSTPSVLESLSSNLISKFPKLQIAGCESPPFRKLTEQESDELVDRVHHSGAKIFFIGLGCPKQDHLTAYKSRWEQPSIFMPAPRAQLPHGCRNVDLNGSFDLQPNHVAYGNGT